MILRIGVGRADAGFRVVAQEALMHWGMSRCLVMTHYSVVNLQSQGHSRVKGLWSLPADHLFLDVVGQTFQEDLSV